MRLGRLSKFDRREARLRSGDRAAFLIRDHGDHAEEELRVALSRCDLTPRKRYELKCVAVALATRRKRDLARAKATALVAYQPSMFSVAGVLRVLGLGDQAKSRRRRS